MSRRRSPASHPDDPLSPAEVEFLRMASRPAEFAAWSAEVLAAWKASPAGQDAIARYEVQFGGAGKRAEKN